MSTKKKYVYCVMWQGNKRRGITEILRDGVITTVAEVAALNEVIEKTQDDNSLVIMNWKYLGTKHISEDSPQ